MWQELTLVGKTSLVTRWRTELMPKAWATNMVTVMARGRRPRTGCTATTASRHWEKEAMAKQQRERTREQLEREVWREEVAVTHLQ